MMTVGELKDYLKCYPDSAIVGAFDDYENEMSYLMIFDPITRETLVQYVLASGTEFAGI